MYVVVKKNTKLYFPMVRDSNFQLIERERSQFYNNLYIFHFYFLSRSNFIPKMMKFCHELEKNLHTISSNLRLLNIGKYLLRKLIELSP